MNTSASAVIGAFPFTLPQTAVLGAESSLAGQEVLCLPDSAFVPDYQGEPVGRFAVTPRVTNEQFARFAAGVSDKVFWRDILPGGKTIAGDDFRDAVSKGIYESTHHRPAEVTREALRTLLDPAHQAFSQLWKSSSLVVGPFRLFEIPSFSYPAERENEPARVHPMYAHAYAAMMGGRLPTPAELQFAKSVDGDFLEEEKGIRVVLPDDPLKILEILPFAVDTKTLPFGGAYLYTILADKGYWGIFAGSITIVAETLLSAVELSRSLGIEGGVACPFVEHEIGNLIG